MLAAMDPATVAKLLSEMDPNEAAVLLSALGDTNGLTVGQALTQPARRKLITVRRVWLGCGLGSVG
jgi:Mg/Co/Ni transporter MgtE